MLDITRSMLCEHVAVCSSPCCVYSLIKAQVPSPRSCPGSRCEKAMRTLDLQSFAEHFWENQSRPVKASAKEAQLPKASKVKERIALRPSSAEVCK